MNGLPTILRHEHLAAKGSGGWHECEECGKKFRATKGSGFMTAELYDHPFDTASRTAMFCSEECYDKLFDHGWADFRYFECCVCKRLVCEQNPSNGWMTQYRECDDRNYDAGDKICLTCYETDLYENGIPKEKYENGTIAGMFFNSDDLEEHGFTKVEGFDYYFINNQEKVDVFCKKAIDLINKGNIVVNEYESLGIGGGEGYVTLWAKLVVVLPPAAPVTDGGK